jgi:hypothetical protein
LAPEERDAAVGEEAKRACLPLDDAPAFGAGMGPVAADLGTGFHGTTVADGGGGLVLE